MKTILFVCTGNVFRSLTAELALARETDKQGLCDTYVSASAGTATGGAHVVPELREIWSSRGLDPEPNGETPVDRALLDRAAVVVSMAENHREALRAEFGCESVLFNELAFGQETSVDDVGEAMPNFREDPEGVRRFMEQTVDQIIKGVPAILRTISNSRT